MRLCTYNVHGCRGSDGRTDPRRIAEVVAAQAPDVVVLQELDVHRARSGAEHQPERIAEALQMRFHFSPAFVSGDEHYGNAVLSRFPLDVVREGELPSLSRYWRTERRGVLWVALDVRGTTVQVLATHFGLLLPERIAQAGALLGADWLADPRCRAPRIVCGDLNSLPGSLPLRRLRRVLVDTVARAPAARARGWRGAEPPAGNTAPGRTRRPGLATYPAAFPVLRIDHVLASNDMVVEAARVPLDPAARRASDHLPLVVDFRVP